MSPARRLKELRGDLRSPYGDKRRRAVAKLGALGSRQAFELVLEMLANDEAEAADEAQLQLPAFEASLGAARVHKELLGRGGLRSPDPMVRLRVAQAFGRLAGPVDGAALLGRLRHRDEAIACALLWSVERLAAAGSLAPTGTGAKGSELLKPLHRLFRPGVADSVRARAIAALVRVDPQGFVARRSQLAELRGRESACAYLEAEVQAAHVLGASGVARAAVCAALVHKDPSQRAMAIRLFPRMRPGREDLAQLAARLDGEPRSALRLRVVGALQDLTGLKHRERAAPWVHSINALPTDWVADDWVAPAPRGQAAETGSLATLERLSPSSDRVGLLIDFSGSLWNEREDGSCRKDLLDPEIDRLLDQLDPGTHFQLIPFTGEPHPFADQSVPATKREVVRAKRFFKKAKMRGQGSLYEAIQAALADAEVDRLIILTDGAPTGGARWNVELMGDLLVEQTRFRPVIFDFVLLDAPPPLQRAWASVAKRTGGRTLALKM